MPELTMAYLENLLGNVCGLPYPSAIAEEITEGSEEQGDLRVVWLGSSYFFESLREAFSNFEGNEKAARERAREVVANPDAYPPRPLPDFLQY
jgi:hypothetical protein